MTLTSPCGVMPSLTPVKPFMSQNNTVITRRCPSAAARTGRSIRLSTMRGSMYLPKVWRMRSLRRSCSTIRLKAAVSWPISFVDVTTMVSSSLPASTARVPSSSRRTGRVIPVLTRVAKTSPSRAASAVRTTEINMTWC